MATPAEQIKELIREYNETQATLEQFTQELGSPWRDHRGFQAASFANQKARMDELILAVQELLPTAIEDTDVVKGMISSIKMNDPLSPRRFTNQEVIDIASGKYTISEVLAKKENFLEENTK